MFLKHTKFKTYDDKRLGVKRIYVMRPVSTTDNRNNIAFKTNQGEFFITSDNKEFAVKDGA